MKSSVWVLVLLAGCISSDSVQIGEKYDPRPEDWPIEVYVSEEAPVGLLEYFEEPRFGGVPEGARVIGKGEVSSDSIVRWASVLKKAALEAQGLGGDGVVFGYGESSRYWVQSHVTFLIYRYAE
jgi:hypothetical protein